ncbi:hypothetical protein POM88_026818 [Heracleum sosnowskyi]|uniref:Uncharacterized protein n=1 Tax=Heracleum sosnowskyi TaxID=360622 RepID=A0AAD8MPK7_9APIA|nr:hypothetical protein POM88_026818 [Heracleum sosnowskyi]
MWIFPADASPARVSASPGGASTTPVPSSARTVSGGASATLGSASPGGATASPAPPSGGAIGRGMLFESSLQRRRINQKKKTFVASNSILDIGDLAQQCGYCGAHVWQAEYTGRHSGPGPKGYSICCGKGKKIQKNLRVYNIIFALCSFGGNVDDSINNGSGLFMFRVNDLTYHSIGSLVPPDGRTPKFAHFYMYDGQESLEHRMNFPKSNNVLDPAIVATLQEMLTRDNALVGIFKQLRERYYAFEQVPVRLRLLERRSIDGRFLSILSDIDYELAGLALDNNFTDNSDILVEYKQTGLETIS